jgi:hypothetical protein
MNAIGRLQDIKATRLAGLIAACPFCNGEWFSLLCERTSALCRSCGAIMPGWWIDGR